MLMGTDHHLRQTIVDVIRDAALLLLLRLNHALDEILEVTLLAAYLLVELGVLDGDGGLGGEPVEEVALVIARRAAPGVDLERAYHLLAHLETDAPAGDGRDAERA